MAVKRVRRAVRGLGNVPSDELSRELDRRRKVASQLEAKRTNLLAEVARLEAEIRGYGGSVRGTTPRGRAADGSRRGGIPGRPRGGRTMTLPQALAKLLRGRTMSVTDMTQAVKKAGYRTSSPNFFTAVSAAVVKHTDLFRRVARGQYTAK